MDTNIKITSKASEDYFKKINEIFLCEPEAIIAVDPDFISLVEEGNVECTKLIFAFDLPIYKIITDKMIALFSIKKCAGANYIHDFYFWMPGSDEVKISNIDYRPLCNYYLFF